MTIGAQQGELAEVGSPVTVPANPALDTREPLGWTTIAIVVATLVLALGNAATVPEWLDERTPTPTIERLRAPAERWHGVTAALHLDGPRDRLHRWWEAARAYRFGNEKPGDPGTD